MMTRISCTPLVSLVSSNTIRLQMFEQLFFGMVCLERFCRNVCYVISAPFSSKPEWHFSLSTARNPSSSVACTFTVV